MSKICELTGTGVMFGNNVSHSERKTRCKYMPNLKKMALYSEVLGQKFRFRISMKALRTVESKGGVDAYLMSAKDSLLSSKARFVKKQIMLKI